MNVLEVAIKACSYQTNFTIFIIAKHMKASLKISVYNDTLENLLRAMEVIPSHNLIIVIVMLSVVMTDVSVCENGFEEHKGDELMLSSFKGNELMLSPFKGDELMLRPFKGNELMHDEYCDGNHCGDLTSLITSVMR
ncbi:hypothetical protein GmHk_04G010751 [Glycine max]|nr:hypothetical protein GmHk_04G010751 [Glycine max]